MFLKNSRVAADFGLMVGSLTYNPNAIVKSSLTNLLMEVQRLCIHCGLVTVRIPKRFTILLHQGTSVLYEDHK